MMNNADFGLLYALFEDITPLAMDCGELCGHGCCHQLDMGEEQKGQDFLPSGMRLFPGEEAFLKELPLPDGYSFVPCRDGGTLLVCGGNCRRTCRPLSCRLFPLFPYVDDAGRVKAVYDPRAWRICPLVQENIHIPLRREFVRSVRRVGRLLMEDTACRDFLKEQSREIDEVNRFLRLDDRSRVRPPICRKTP